MKRNIPLLLYRIAAIILCLAGLIGAFDAFPAGRQASLFSTWSCLLSLAVWLLLLRKPAGFARLQGMAAMCGLLGMIFFHFVLPMYSVTTVNASQRLVNLLLRTVIPLMMLGDFLLFRPRKPLAKHTPLLWTVFPAVWFLFALLLPALNEHVWSALPSFPYFFLNPRSGWILHSPQGYPGVILNGIAILAVYILAGYMLLGAYHRHVSGLTCYRLLAAMLCLYGQLGSFGAFSGRANWDAACYFTNLSNILCLITWLLLLWKPHGFSRLHGMAAQAILLTMIVFHAVLSNFDFRLQTVSQFNNHVVHTFVPLLMITDFLFLRRPVRLRWYTPFVWVLAPVVYLGFALLMPTLESNFFPGMTRYPYFFMNPFSGWLLPAPQGIAGVFLNCAVIAVAYICAGYLMCGVHLLSARLRRRPGAA